MESFYPQGKKRRLEKLIRILVAASHGKWAKPLLKTPSGWTVTNAQGKPFMPIALFFATLLLYSAVAEPSEKAFTVTALSTPAAADSAEPHLALGQDGSVVLSWLLRDGDGVALRFSVLGNKGWQPAKTVSSGNDWFVNWADFPSVIPMTSDLWAAHWLAKKPGGTYAYDVVMALSQDGGETWSEPFSPHSDNTKTEHGFVSMFPWRDGVGALWLDGRNMVQDGATDGQDSETEDSGGGMTLRAALIAPDASIVDEYLVDDLVCDCCQTDIAIGPGGPIAVYRDRSASEIRDIYVSRVIEGQWLEGEGIGNDGWEIAGCPVNGPAIDAVGSDAVVAWFTSARSVPHVRFARSMDQAATFSAPINIDTGQPLGRVDVALLDSGMASVSWLRTTDDRRGELVMRLVSKTGEPGPVQVIAPTSSERPAGFPQMISKGNQLIFAWTDTSGDSPRVRTAQVDIVY
jgi:hypothetical protein